jgi:KTSC domain
MKSRCAVVCLLVAAIAQTYASSAPRAGAVTSRIPRHPTDSKAIAVIGYSKRLHVLEIQFTNGAIYRYLEVAPSVYRELIASDSKGHYYDTNIKRNYRSLHVRRRVTQQTH